MSLQLTLKLNNQIVTDHISPVRIFNDYPTLSWEFDTLDKFSVDTTTGVTTDVGDLTQVSYEIEISTSDYGIGNTRFTGDVSRTDTVASKELFWAYNGFPLERGVVYYGQVRATDEANRITDFSTFSFSYNSLPVVTNVEITPALPAPTDNLVLDYDYSDADGDVESGTTIRWFKNGVHQRQFDNATIIKSSFLQNNDIWNVDVYPSDGYEHGSRVTSPQVKVTSTQITVSELSVLPKHPNPDDIIKANYEISDEFESENVFIRWYVNNLIVQDVNDLQFVKLDIQEGDQVRFDVRQKDATFYSSSPTATVIASDFIVTDIQVDGRSNPLDVSTITPHVGWKRFVPSGKSVNYISIKIGTFFESNNIYSTTISGDRNAFTIPANTLEKGRDYYIGIAISDTQTFNKYTTSHFRVRGSNWEEDVSNSTGWTFETLFVSDSVTGTGYQVLRINDGDRFAEVRLYASKISLISGSTVEYAVSTVANNFLTVAGKNDDIKIYLNRELIINGEGIFTQESNIKRLELSHNDSFSTTPININYKYFFYTVSGYFLPGIASEYSNLQFHDYIEFQSNEVVALQGYVGGKYVFGLNSDNESESSTIYSIGPGDVTRTGTIARTYSPISSISKSPDGTKTVVSHAGGASVITGYLINPFDHEMIFVSDTGVLNETFPTSSGWELVENINTASAYFDTDGFHIDTIQ
jgi:hypothetical protein